MVDDQSGPGSVPSVPHSPAPPPAPAHEEYEPMGLEFDGTGAEYFGIWIVNLLLTMVTFGIFGAWAKVRRLRYFYGNTRLGLDSFEFLATGLQIFKGRLIVVLVLVIYSASQLISPLIQGVLLLILLPFVPQVINMSLRFRAGMTMWRNIRFRFEGDYWHALIVFVLMPAAGLMTLGLLFPLASQMAAKYVANNYRYGTANFSGEPRVGPFYAAFFIGLAVTVGVAIIVLIIMAIAMLGVGSLASKPGADWLWYLQNNDGVAISFSMLGIAAYFIAFVVAGQVYLAITRNEIINSISLDGGHRFGSHLSPAKMAWIALSNMVVIIFTLGLMQPWAAVRLWKYQVSRYAVQPGSPIDRFVEEQQDAVSAFGAEFADFEGFDIGIGL